MSGFTTVDMIVLIIYLLIVLLIGIFFSKKEMKGKEYFKGDGTIPWWVTSVSIFATLLSPISFLSIVGNSFNGTWLLWFAQLGVFIAVPITIKFFLPIYSRLDIDTAYHYLELRYNDKGLRALGAFMFIIYQIGRMSIIMYLPSIVLSELIGTNVNILIIIMGIIAIIYSYKGGIKSVLWTDFIQGIVLIIGVSFTLIFLAHSIDGGIGEVFNYLINNKFLAKNETIIDLNILNSSVFIIVVGSGVNIFSSYISSQDIVQRDVYKRQVFIIEIISTQKIKDKNTVEYIRKMKNILLNNPEYKKGIEILINSIEENLNSNNKLNSLKQEYKGLIEESLNQGNIENSIKMIDEYESIFKEDLLLNFRAIVSIYKSEFEKADYYLKQAYIRDNNDYNIIFNIAYVKELLGETKEAKKFYSLVLNSDNSEIKIEAKNRLSEIKNKEL